MLEANTIKTVSWIGYERLLKKKKGKERENDIPGILSEYNRKITGL